MPDCRTDHEKRPCFLDLSSLRLQYNQEEKIRRELYLTLHLGQGGGQLHLVMVFLQGEEDNEGCETGEGVQCPVYPRQSPTHAFMLLPLPLSTMYGVFWAFCFSWSSATVPRGVSLELIFFRSCGATVGQNRGSTPSIPHSTQKCRAPTSLRRPTASSSSFFIRRSVFILPEPFPWKR